MKKKLNKIAITLCAVALISSCKTGNDLYNSPQSPRDVPPALALTSLEVNTFLNTEGDFARVSSIFAQQTAGVSNYAALQNYVLQTGDYNNHWTGLYSNSMYNAKVMIDKYSTVSPYYAGMAKVLMALNLSIASDFWGDVPYSDAFKGETLYFTTKYDAQKDVYTSIQSLLDAALLDFAKPVKSNLNTPGVDDAIFQGKISQWITATWTLKARYANRLSLKDPQGSATKVLTYLANGIKSSADNMENPHNANNSHNQWYDYQNIRGISIIANKVFTDALKSNNDPRLPYYFAADEDTGDIIGADINATQINTSAALTGNYFNGPNNDGSANYGSVTFHEAKFLEAEAKSRLGQDATTALNDGIKASVAYVTKGASDGSAIANYVNPTITTIMTEKWKAMFGHIEAYNDVRRTNIPALTPRPRSAGAILGYTPKRLPTPTAESDGNPNAKFIPLDQPVWWATSAQ